MKTQSRKAILVFSIFLATLFLLAQIAIRVVFYGGWCSTSLDAPTELDHPAYWYYAYGFPQSFLEITIENCSEVASTTYERSPGGIVVDSLLLALIAYPTWVRFLRKSATNQKSLERNP